MFYFLHNNKWNLARFEFQVFDRISYITTMPSKKSTSSNFRMIWPFIFVVANSQISCGDEVGNIRPSTDAGGIVDNVSSTGLRLPSIGLRTETLEHYKLVTQQTNSGVHQRVRRESDLQVASPGVCVLARDNKTGDANTRFYAQHEARGNCTQPDDVFYGWPATESTCNNITAYLPTCIYYTEPGFGWVTHCDLPIPWQMPSPVYIDRNVLGECGLTFPLSSSPQIISGIVPFLEAPCPAVLQTSTNLVLPPMLQNISYNRHWIPSCQIIHHLNWTYESRFCLREENSPMLCDDSVGETSYTYHYVSELQCSNMMNHAVCFQFVWPEQEYRHITPHRVCQNIFDNDTQTTRQSQDLVYICAGIHGTLLSSIVASGVVVSRTQLVREKDCHDILNPPMNNVTTEDIATLALDIVHMVISPIGVLVNSLGLLVICGKEFRLQETYARVTEFFVSNMIYLTIPWTYCVINTGKIGITNTVSYVCKAGLIAFKITTCITHIAFLVMVVERFVGTCRPRLYSIFTTGKLVADRL